MVGGFAKIGVGLVRWWRRGRRVVTCVGSFRWGRGLRSRGRSFIAHWHTASLAERGVRGKAGKRLLGVLWGSGLAVRTGVAVGARTARRGV